MNFLIGNELGLVVCFSAAPFMLLQGSDISVKTKSCRSLRNSAGVYFLQAYAPTQPYERGIKFSHGYSIQCIQYIAGVYC